MGNILDGHRLGKLSGYRSHLPLKSRDILGQALTDLPPPPPPRLRQQQPPLCAGHPRTSAASELSLHYLSFHCDLQDALNYLYLADEEIETERPRSTFKFR